MNMLTRYYAKDTGLVTLNVAGETIIVPIKNKVGDLDSIYTLNEMDTTIWQLLDGRKSVSQLVEAIYNDCQIKPEETERDTLDF